MKKITDLYETEYIIDQFEDIPSVDDVWKQLGKRPLEDPILQEKISSYYRDDLKWIREKLSPKACVTLKKLDVHFSLLCSLPEGAEVMLVCLTMGDGCEERKEEVFQLGEHVHALEFDALLNAWLFSMDLSVQERLRTICGQLHRGIVDRLEAPEQMPIEMQQWIAKAMPPEMGISCNSSYQLYPAKSLTYLCVLTDDKTVLRAQHDCRRCRNRDCANRAAGEIRPVNVLVQDQGKKISGASGDNLLSLLLAHDCLINTSCGGIGKCGKCKVQVLSGNLAVTESDRKYLTSRELDDGIRLACTAILQENIRIRIVEKPAKVMKAVVDTASRVSKQMDQADIQTGCRVAIDIGTTTIAASLFGTVSDTVYATSSVINSGRKYGGDVLARMEASCRENRREELQQLMKQDLRQVIDDLLRQVQQDKSRVKEIAIAGNMTMVHLFMGYSCETLGRAPFQPVNAGLITETGEILGLSKDCTVTICPAISAFVGGDIVAGMLALDFDKKENAVLMIDFGTNAELVLADHGQYYVSSAAAGPAFEGGGLSCGCGSIDGAIESVKLSEKKRQYSTIGNGSPVGLCGSGAIEFLSELLRIGIVDETGEMAEEYQESGFCICKGRHGEEIGMSQSDVRQLQLALAAIRAGVDTLLHTAGLSYSDIETVYLAGGFGIHLSTSAAVSLGLFPSEAEEKIQAVGNVSLLGARCLLAEKQAKTRMEQMIAHATEVVLADDEGFQERFMNAMNFRRES